MRKFLEDHDLEVLLIIIAVVEITRWWVPKELGSQHMYAVSHWVLSYDQGLLRRGLVGAIMELWVPIVSFGSVERTGVTVYYVFLILLLAVCYAFLRYKDKEGRLFRVILFFLVSPVTIALLARDIGLFDIFLTMFAFLSLVLLSFKRHYWLVPILLVTAMFVHEGFMILYAPTLVAVMIFVYYWNGRERKILATLLISTTAVVVSFFILYRYGNPTLGMNEFADALQSRAAFPVTPLSIRECYYSIVDHYRLASSSLYDAGSIANFVLALLILSPAILVLLNLWNHALRNCGTHRLVCALLFLATLSGLLLIPIATDYGRWLSAVIFCNFFAIFFLVNMDVIRVEELVEYAGGQSKSLFVLIILTYVFFGPFRDWNPYPYRDNVILSSLFIVLALSFDVGFYLRSRSLDTVTQLTR